jgi:hypothetical protein
VYILLDEAQYRSAEFWSRKFLGMELDVHTLKYDRQAAHQYALKNNG